ncbi:MAG: LacI family DNA-binding transcriptional regulator [Rhodospirillaceae bacterium]|nr:LacI family DNA-binding transcriptional regulator [Rhodospirillaceae bacterium]MCY4066210.1 LacI family DNA-binding transcriptional regulator [Rhodospirillaceae bacterium]
MARLGKRGRLPGIVDVAERAKVSPATVSRYFNDPDIVRYRTRERIRKAVEDLGYVRNRAMRSMVGGATGCIGLVIPTIDNAIFSEMLQAFSSALATHGRTMLIAAHGYDLAREAVLVHSLSEQRVDALALIGLEHRPETLAQIERQGIPAAMLWNYRPDQDWPCIGFDNELAGRLAAEHLLALGHRDILFATAEERSNDRAADRRRGALDAVRGAGLPVPEGRRIVCPYDIRMSKELIAGTLRAGDRPSAIFAGNDVIAQGALFAATSLGIRVPDDLSVIGIGDFRGSDAFEPGLTTVRIPARRIGQLAADALVETIDWPEADFHHEHCCPLELIVRGTCGSPSAAG